MTNKYQEALNELKSWSTTSSIPIGADKHFVYEQSHKIQELVDTYPEYLELKERATPKKPIYESKLMRYGYRCPICRWFVEGDFCKNCGQALDWSEE
jgi:hypothetical protein